MKNLCVFSKDRKYRYSLYHRLDTPPLIMTGIDPMFIGLNPSTADEQQLDNTLRILAAFTFTLGGEHFTMANLFAYRATDPAKMKEQDDPIGPENDETLRNLASLCSPIVCCWGAHGSHLGRAMKVYAMLQGKGPLYCFTQNQDGSPHHPLYLKKPLKLEPFDPV